MFGKSRSIVGLDIGTSAVKAVELTETGGKLEVTGFGQVEVKSDDATAKAGRRLVGAVIADDDSRPPLARLGADDRFEVDLDDVPATHQRVRPSGAVCSQAALSSEAVHSSQASP